MLASVVHILPLTTIRRERVLPIPGKVLVRQGQKVAPRDVVAEASVAPEHLLLNVPRSLGVSVKEAETLIQRAAGDQVGEGDLIAGPIGLTRRVLRAPVAGRIALIQDGKVLLEVDTPPYQLRAGLVGVVSDLIADRGAVIETVGALVQGIWGNGRMEFGLMQSKLETPESKLTSDQVEVSLRGAVVLGGYCDSPKALRNAADIPVKGLILSSMAASLVPLAAKMPFPVLVLRGFGDQPLDPASFKLLTSNQNREVSVNAVAFDRFNGTRPEVVIPLPSSNEPPLPLETEDFAVRQRVRLARSAEVECVGIIQKIFEHPVPLASGLQAMAAKVALENGETVTVPLANLEVLT
ncbi:MAG TPA: hypothetical protein DEH25_18630 [Chloroflexi bacterium]|nr:hypothetical protein [Chloroflexota bacterium]HBY09600.1 hypothetical protein [Chloroflexota bacterium]